MMRGVAENLTNRIAKIPMAMVLIPFALGIFFVERCQLPVWLPLSLCVVSVVGVISLAEWWQRVALALSLFAVGALIHTLSYRGTIAYGEPVEMVIRIETSSVSREGYTSAEATIEECESRTLSARKVVVWGDSLTNFRAGDRLLLTTPIRPFRAEREQYAQLMHHRGFVGAISLNHRATYQYIPAERRSLHDWAVERLRSALKPSNARAVVLAMTTGERGEIGNELRKYYSASGASHLLAVSGLHIGIAFMLINILLLPLILLRYGNVVRSVVAVALIWLYVWLCGVSPSAVRAAIMFSLLQFSLSSLREYASVNILAGTAFVMLALDSHLLFDISFQLSFIAVAGIVLWAMPLYRLCTIRFKVANIVIGVLIVGLTSTFATMPLVANTFSTISLVGVLINPVVILLANIIVLAGLLSLGIPPVAVIAEISAKWQNSIIEWSASLPFGHFNATIPDWVMWVLYLLFGVATLAIWLLPKQEKMHKIKG